MKKIFLLCMSMLLLFAYSCKDDAVYKMPNVIVKLDVSGVEAVEGKMHIFYFKSDDYLFQHDFLQTIAAYQTTLPYGEYSYLAVTGVPDDILDIYVVEHLASKAEIPVVSTVKQADFRRWLSEHVNQYPEMMTDDGSFKAHSTHIENLTIEFELGCDGALPLSSLQVQCQLPKPSLQPFANRSSEQPGLKLRCFYEIYKQGMDTPVHTEVSYPEVNEEGILTLQYKLESGSYSMAVWADYVMEKDIAFYTAESLKKVKVITDPYKANTDAKDAAYLYIEDIAAKGRPIALTAQLNRPLAKYELVATDVERYLAKKDELGLPPLDELQVKVNYLGFFPVGFNVVTGKPNDAVASVVNYGSAVDTAKVSVGTLPLGSDWVMVNGDETFVEAELLITDSKGRMVSRVPRVRIDYRRNCLTTVKGKFLTAGIQEGGVHIDTEWEGNFEVEF